MDTALVKQLVEGKENSEFKPVKLCLKIDLVSYPARAEEGWLIGLIWKSKIFFFSKCFSINVSSALFGIGLY